MATRACGNSHQTISALFDGFVGEFVVDDVVQNHAAIAVRGLVDFFTRTQRCDDDRDFVFDAHGHVVFQAVIAFVHDLVDGERRCGLVRMRLIVGSQPFGDL